CFWNASKQRGVLEARLAQHTPYGVELYDEVGVSKDALPVASTLAQALGTLRRRALAGQTDAPCIVDLLKLEVDALEVFRLLTLCMKTKSPINALAELHGLLLRPNVRTFLGTVFSEEDLLSILRAAQA